MQGLISNPSVWRDRFVLNSKYTNAVKTLSQKNQSTEFIVNSFAVKYLQSPRSTNAMSVALRNCGFDLLVALARNRFLLSAPQTWRHVSASSSLAVIESLCLWVNYSCAKATAHFKYSKYCLGMTGQHNTWI